MSEIYDNMLDLLRSDKSKAYLKCLKTDKKEDVEQVEKKLKEAEKIVKSLKNSKLMITAKLELTIKLLQIVRDITIIQSSRDMLTHGISKCSNEYIDNVMYATGRTNDMSNKQILEMEQILKSMKK